MESSVKVVHKKDAYDVYIGRPSIFGNPFPVEHYGRSECLKKFRDYFFQRIRTDPKFKKAIETLRGKTLACYCSPQACHGDIIEEDSYEIATALAARDLKVEFNIDQGALEALVPNMILQPLVENAIRHGIANKVANGKIGISAKRRGSDLLLKVSDNGMGLSPSGVLTIKQGVGLTSTKGRLERLYGSGQALQLEAPETGGFVARIVVPFTTAKMRSSIGKDENPDR